MEGGDTVTGLSSDLAPERMEGWTQGNPASQKVKGNGGSEKWIGRSKES